MCEVEVDEVVYQILLVLWHEVDEVDELNTSRLIMYLAMHFVLLCEPEEQHEPHDVIDLTEGQVEYEMYLFYDEVDEVNQEQSD